MSFLPQLKFTNLRGDVLGGLTAAVVALPLALAFGVSSGIGPIAGLYGAICVGFFAALFGGTATQVSGPTGPMTVVMGSVFAHYMVLDPENGAAIAFTIVVMAGALQILFAFLKIGKYINYVPQPIISGFMSGIGFIIIILQLSPLLGQDAQLNTVSALITLPEALGSVHWLTFLLGILSLIIVFFTPASIAKYIPSPLLALTLGTLVVLIFMPENSVSILGDIPSGFPSLQMPKIPLLLLPEMLKYALILALLGTIDSLLTSLVADNTTRTTHHSDKELFGQGLGNVVSGLVGGLPGAGATMRTMINVKAGGKTQLSGMLHALILLTVALGLGGVASYIPHVVLSGILIKVGTDIIDWQYLRRIHRSSRAGVIIMFTVLLMTVFVDLILAVAVGLVAASMLFVKRQSDLQFASIALFRNGSEANILDDQERTTLDIIANKANVLFFHLGYALSFGVAKALNKKLSEQQNFQLLILDLSAIQAIDYSASKAIEEMIETTQAQGIEVLVVDGYGQVQEDLKRENILAAINAECVFSNRKALFSHFID
jgi:SulP family sulfate permease